MSLGVETHSSPAWMASRSRRSATTASSTGFLDAGRRDAMTPSLTKSTSIRGTATTGHCSVGDDGSMTAIRINAITVPWSWRLALTIVAVVCAACSSNGLRRTSSTSHLASSGPVGCLDPRAAATPPAGGWLPDTTGASDYEPENAGVERSPSARTAMLATRVRGALGHDFSVSTVREFATTSCVVDRDVVLRDGSGDVAFLRVLQLRQPLNDGSFPLVGNSMIRRRLAHGSLLLTNHLADNSEVTVVLTRADGLLVELQVRSSTGQDTSGWPTTMPTMPPSQPAVASPITIAQAAAVTQRLATLAVTGV
jgi:hypothetical protein